MTLVIQNPSIHINITYQFEALRGNMQEKLDQLKSILATVSDLHGATALLSWDQQCYMPPGGVIARGNQIGTLSSLAHSKFVSDEVGSLLEELNLTLNPLTPKMTMLV